MSWPSARSGVGLTVEDGALDVEHVRARRIEVVVKLLCNLDPRCHYKGSGGVEGKGRKRDAPGLSAANRKDDSDLALFLLGIAGELGKLRICLPLGRANTRIA